MEYWQKDIETMNREDLIQDVPEKALIQLIKFCTKNAQSSPYRKFHWVGMFPDLITEADLDIPPKNVGRLLKDNEKQLLECHISFSICRRNGEKGRHHKRNRTFL